MLQRAAFAASRLLALGRTGGSSSSSRAAAAAAVDISASPGVVLPGRSLVARASASSAATSPPPDFPVGGGGGRRLSAPDDEGPTPPPAVLGPPPPVNGDAPSLLADAEIRRRGRSGGGERASAVARESKPLLESAREKLLEQLGATLPPPPPPSRSSARRAGGAPMPSSAGSVRPRQRRPRRRRMSDAAAAVAPGYARPLSLRRRDGADGSRSPHARELAGEREHDDIDDDDDIDADPEPDPESGVVARLRVESVHAARSIDVVDVLSGVFGGGTGRSPEDGTRWRPLRHVFGKTSLVVQLPPAAAAASGPSSADDGTGDDAAAQRSAAAAAPAPAPELELPRYVAVYRFGSVVFFNVSSADAGRILDDVKRRGARDPVPSGSERRERFEVAVRPSMDPRAGRANGDYATLRNLDANGVAVVSKILAQTVAIDSYSDAVDELLASFAKINSSVRETGSFTDMEKAQLFKVVARNNSLFIDMIGKLGIKDRSDTAWNLSQYERVWDDMREEFEIDERFGQIEFKLNLIQQNAKFFLEMLHHQKTNSLEWIIVVLIGFECVLMCLDMSGMGEAAFAALPWDAAPFDFAPPPPPK